MELTQSWAEVLPEHLLERYSVVETRNAARIFQSTHPQEFEDLCFVLDQFFFDLDRIVMPGGSKHLISREIDEAFRELGWREGRYQQELITTLALEPYRPANERVRERRESVNNYGGHKIDNIKGRIGLDVEWNPKDGNLDRDLNNFRALYDGGAIDVGVIITRTVAGMRDLWIDTIARGKAIASGPQWSPEWQRRITKTPDDPLATSTTSNFEKLVPRVERGDGGGCPILAIAITPALYSPPRNLDDGLIELAQSVDAGSQSVRLAQRMRLVPLTEYAPDVMYGPDDADQE